MEAFVPKSVAQLTGILVTAIVTFGTDVDVTYAMPLGVAAGALAVFFVALAEGPDRPSGLRGRPMNRQSISQPVRRRPLAGSR
jgi:hypothetical protein